MDFNGKTLDKLSMQRGPEMLWVDIGDVPMMMQDGWWILRQRSDGAQGWQVCGNICTGEKAMSIPRVPDGF